ncbi:MAG: L-arabinose ABC transporter permease AraH [Planctomycetota bacterium]|nr:L-arabinose ABC transporter permease AraH [Planctomycetota bacterium]
MPQPDGPRNKPLSARAGMSRLSAWRTIWERSGMLLVFVALVVVCSIWVPKFPSLRNMDALFLAIATIGIIACTMLFCLASGDFDLSVGSVVALSGVVAALVTNFTGSVVLGILSGMLAGALVGLANGFVIAFLGINALITTLATMQIARGLGLLAGGGGPVGVGNAGFYVLGTSSLHDIPWLRWLGDTGNVGAWLLGLSSPIWIVLVCFIIFGLLLKKTIFGRNTLAIGGNKEAAMLAGIPVRLTKIVIFSLQGMVAGFAGVVQASQMNMGDPDVSKGLELQVISACVLGGVSLTGGVGTMTGVVMGVLIMGIVENAMTLLNMPTFWQYVTSGSILLAAVLFDRLKQRRAV